MKCPKWTASVRMIISRQHFRRLLLRSRTISTITLQWNDLNSLKYRFLFFLFLYLISHYNYHHITNRKGFLVSNPTWCIHERVNLQWYYVKRPWMAVPGHKQRPRIYFSHSFSSALWPLPVQQSDIYYTAMSRPGYVP